jgi:transcriptional regulator with XRE-family HTH domain
MSTSRKQTLRPHRQQTATSPAQATPIRIWHPTIHGTPITTAKHLHHVITNQYPGLTRNPHFPQLLTDAKTHLTLITLLGREHRLRRGDFTRLARQVAASRQLVTAYIHQARQPRLYYLIEHTLTKTDAHARLALIQREGNGLCSTHDVKRRLATYYLAPFHEKSPQHQRRLAQCNAYFHALKMFSDGGCFIDAARALGVHHSQVSRWLSGHRPDLVELARRIPDQLPAPAHKWLPLKIDYAFRPTDFIQVPSHVTNHAQIEGVLEQLRPLDNTKMKLYVRRFAPVTKEEAFYYLLGLIVSDFAKNRPRTSSTELVLNLSKKYEWAQQLGEAACYYLGMLGIHATRAEDTASSKGPRTCYSWRSQKSTFMTWVICTCLGLKEHQRTTYHPLEGRWLLEVPKPDRVAFLQGLNDGDGWASTRDQSLGNACAPNIRFVRDLLLTLGINSASDGARVRIRSQAGITRATQIPFFRHALERQRNANKLAEMVSVRQQQMPGTTSPKIAETILTLRAKGLSYSEIAEQLFDKFGVSFDHSHVMRRMKRRTDSEST